MNNNRYCTKAGFTLIELLLVITLISILTVSATLTYRNHVQANREQLLAAQMQTILSAALTYYGDKNQWPDSRSDLGNCDFTPPAPQDNFVQYYVPNQNAQANNGNYFCWGPLSNVPPPANPQLFWVALLIPHNDALAAKRIAALLPNAVATTDPTAFTPNPCIDAQQRCYVRAQISGMQNTTQASANNVAGAGYCIEQKAPTQGSAPGMSCVQAGEAKETGPTQYQITFNCPANQTGSVIAAATFTFYKANPTYTMDSLEAHPTSCTATPTGNNNQITCNLDVNVLMEGKRNAGYPEWGTAGATYTAYCVASPTQARNNWY